MVTGTLHPCACLWSQGENSQLQLEIERLQQEEAAAGSLSEAREARGWVRLDLVDPLLVCILEGNQKTTDHFWANSF